MNINISNEAFGTLCICALRYAMGRQTYMPSLVRDIIRPYLPKLTNRDIGILRNDCRIQDTYDNYGSDTIDKPGWIRWHADGYQPYGSFRPIHRKIQCIQPIGRIRNRMHVG